MYFDDTIRFLSLQNEWMFEGDWLHFVAFHLQYFNDTVQGCGISIADNIRQWSLVRSHQF